MILGITGNTTKQAIKKAVFDLLDWLKSRNVEYKIDVELANFLNLKENRSTEPLKILRKQCDILLSFGGDGTILSTARAVGNAGTPILGVNLGGLGFLTEVGLADLYPTLEKIIEGQYTLLERKLIKATVIQQKHRENHFALNDIVIDRGGFSRVIRLDVYIDDLFLNSYVGDGIIVATPTGSTAYSMSAYGPILFPDVNCLIINPICPHTLSVRPVVVNDRSVVKIVPDLKESIVTLSVDGQISQQFAKNQQVEIVLKKADYKINCVQNESKNFNELLRKKLNWGIDKRGK